MSVPWKRLTNCKETANTCDGVESDKYRSGMLLVLTILSNPRQSLMLCGPPTLSANIVNTLSKFLLIDAGVKSDHVAALRHQTE